MAWAALAGLAGFASAATFSSWLQWPRGTFVLAHAGVTLLFLAVFVSRTGVRPLVQLRRRWASGLAVGLLGGIVLAYGVQGQPPSPRPTGAALISDIVWLGLVYGTADALLLTVVPVLAVYGTRSPETLARGVTRLQWGAWALLASLAVTAAYHLGFAEFRGARLVQPLIGNGLATIAYLLAGNPLAPILAHVTMHLAAVLHGAGTTVQLPPHY